MAKAVAAAEAGKTRDAISGFEALLKRAPEVIPARYNLALLLLQSGRIKEALGHLDRVLAKDPRHGPSLFSKAKALLVLDRPAEAAALLAPLAPSNDPEVLLALGNAWRRQGRLDEAEAIGRRLTQLAPGFAAGHRNLCQLLAERAPERALPDLRHAVTLHPKNAELNAMLGHCLLRLGRLEEADATLKTALTLDPALVAARGHRLRVARELCDWDEEDRLFAHMRDDLSTTTPKQLAIATQDAIFYPFSGAEIRRIAQAEAMFRAGGVTLLPTPRPKARTALTVGFLSPDYREHATMHLAGDVFAHFDRGVLRPIAYSVGPDDGSGWRDRIAAQADGFVDLAGLSDREAAERIAADGVHVLLDLSVYTRHARPGIAARRPAPVQAAWLGLAASSGAPWNDYALVDPLLVPPAHRDHFSEKLVYLPHGYQPSLALIAAAPPPPRADLGLPESGVVFCSFNGHRKIDRASFALWMAILTDVPGSVLWMLAPPPAARQRLEAAARSAGIDPARLIFAPYCARPEHLRRLGAADLFLDALVCGAHTTAADCLRVGLPLITVAGERLASRVAASLLGAVGIPELVTDSAAAFRALSVALAGDLERRRDLRARLAAAVSASVPFDPPRFARDLEAAVAAMWARHHAGRKAEDIPL